MALAAPPNLPPTASVAGPTFDPEELAGRKIIALFDRAEARDFTDVYVLAQRYPKSLLLARAAEVDLGFDLQIFSDMLNTLSRFSNEELPIDTSHIHALHGFFTGFGDRAGGLCCHALKCSRAAWRQRAGV